MFEKIALRCLPSLAGSVFIRTPSSRVPLLQRKSHGPAFEGFSPISTSVTHCPFKHLIGKWASLGDPKFQKLSWTQEVLSHQNWHSGAPTPNQKPQTTPPSHCGFNLSTFNLQPILQKHQDSSTADALPTHIIGKLATYFQERQHLSTGNSPHFLLPDPLTSSYLLSIFRRR